MIAGRVKIRSDHPAFNGVIPITTFDAQNQLMPFCSVGKARAGMHFYSSGSYNHELALMKDPEYVNRAESGLLHVAFNVGNFDKLTELKSLLESTGYPVGNVVNHTISHSFYTRDPDGYTIELTMDCPKMSGRIILKHSNRTAFFSVNIDGFVRNRASLDSGY